MKPTKTETLLFGPDGAADPRSPFFLERHLIPTDMWRARYAEMPTKLQEVIDRHEKDPWSEGYRHRQN